MMPVQTVDFRNEKTAIQGQSGAGEDVPLARFADLQAGFQEQFERVFPHPRVPRAVVVIPSLSMDPDVLAKIDGVHHYEERMLFMLMLLQWPRTRLIYVTSQPIDPVIIDYYLHLLPGIPGVHARKRLTLFSCHDASPLPLTQKILDRPRVLDRIRAAVGDPDAAHLTCFNATPLERTLAVALGIPLYATDPILAHLGSKSGSRAVFRDAGVPMPDGFEDLHEVEAIIEALVALKRRQPALKKAVVKLNDGFSGEGNAVFGFQGAPADADALPDWVTQVLATRLRFEARGETWETYREKFKEMGGIVEAWVDGEDKRSPSVQCRINPLGEAVVISTHDQVLGGPSGQIFLGCTFPADPAYRLAIQAAGQRIADVLKRHGVLGRFGVDFISVREGDQWKHYAIEINLRKGGTTHPFLMLSFLTDGAFDVETGLYHTPNGQPRYYYASDNVQHPAYKGLTPEDILDIAVYHGLHFHGATQQGVVFHLIGALSEFGKLGVLCIGDSPEKAHALYAETIALLNQETGVDQPDA